MIRFKKFVLQEKTSKIETSIALADSNITIGVEFEYIDSFIREGVQNNQDTDDLLSDYNKLEREVEMALGHRRDDENDWENEMKAEYQYAVQKLKDIIEVIKKDLKGMEGNDTEDLDDLAEKGALEEELEDAKNQLVDLEETEYWDWGESEGWEYNYFDRYYHGMPRPSERLADWWREEHDIEGYDIDNGIDSYIAFDDIGDWNSLPKPKGEGGGTYGPEPSRDEWKRACNEFFQFDDLPSFVKPYKVLFYQEDKGYKGWHIEEDGSLTAPGNTEIVTPPFKITDIDKIVKKMFEFVNSHGKTDNSCGMHVHISYEGKNLVKDMDLFKLMLFMEEGWIYKNFPSRERNQYCRSMLSKIDSKFNGDDSKRDLKVALNMLQRQTAEMFATFTDNLLPSSGKYNSINWEPLRTKSPHIEIRWAGGEDYSLKYDKIKQTIGRYGHYLKLALDKDYKKKEYIQKLHRLYNKTKPNEPTTDLLQGKVDAALSKKLKDKGKFLGRGEGYYSSLVMALPRYDVYAYKDNAYLVSNLGRVEKLAPLKVFGKRYLKLLKKYKIVGFKRETINWRSTFGSML